MPILCRLRCRTHSAYWIPVCTVSRLLSISSTTTSSPATKYESRFLLGRGVWLVALIRPWPMSLFAFLRDDMACHWTGMGDKSWNEELISEPGSGKRERHGSSKKKKRQTASSGPRQKLQRNSMGPPRLALRLTSFRLLVLTHVVENKHALDH